MSNIKIRPIRHCSSLGCQSAPEEESFFIVSITSEVNIVLCANCTGALERDRGMVAR